MNLNDHRDVVSSLFVMLNQKPYILLRIEFLVVLVTLLFLAMFIMDIFRRYIHNVTMKAIFSLLDAVSDSIVIYLLGAMQTTPFKNQLFPVWALVLVSFRYSVDFISGYGVPDHGGRRFTEYRNVVKLLGSAFLNWSRGSRFARPLWSLWALQILRSTYRFYVRNLALNSAWHGMSSELITEHLRNWKPEECDPKTMEGYRYLVYGETNRKIDLEKPRYVLHIDDTSRWPRNTQQERSSLITLDKIWGCCRHLLHHDNSQGKDLKDLSLAFALSRLLRCRLEDMALQGDVLRINRKLVKARIVEEPDARRALRILELQLAFLDDYFNTRYPMVFWSGLSSLCWSLLLSVVTFGIVCWLAVDMRRVYKPPEGELAHVVQGFNVDMIITWVFMFFMMFKEIWEMVTYLLSDWTRLLLVCRYAQRKDDRTRGRCMESVILSFFKYKIIARRWHGHIDQYVFLESYNDKPKFWNLLHKLTTGMVPKKEDGAKLSSAIDVPEYVMPAILEKLGAILGKPADPDISSLPKDISSLPKNGERWKLYGWACIDLPTCSHIILVWHIATSLCEMELAKTQGVDLSNPGLLCSLLSCFTNCCSSKPYLMNEKKLTDELQKRYIIANSLSRYCAYLLVSKSDLIPDSFLVPNMIFQQTVKDARDDILKDCDSLQSRYDKLMKEAKKAAQEADAVKKNEDTVRMGAMLGRELIGRESEDDRWEILAGVWADLLVHIAPSWNAEAHKKCLESGGEFITHIWALLWHCGIEKSRLWPEEDVPENGQGNVVRGIQNLGNTCYFNAVLQSLLALDKLRIKMLEQDPPAGPLHFELKKLFKETSGANDAGGTLVPENLFSIMCSRNSDFKHGVMEDSNNVLSSLIDCLSKEQPTMVESLFRGQVAKHVSSKECEHTSVTTQVLDLSLAIPSKKHVSIEDCLDLYATGEVDDWDCTACCAAAGNASSNQKGTTVDDEQTEQLDSGTHQKEQSSHPAEKQTSTPNQDKEKLPMLDGDAHQMEQSHNKHKEEENIYRAATVQFRIRKAPPLLTIQLKRFDYVHPDRSDKLEEHVSFQETLDITKFMDPRYGQFYSVEYNQVSFLKYQFNNNISDLR